MMPNRQKQLCLALAAVMYKITEQVYRLAGCCHVVKITEQLVMVK